MRDGRLRRPVGQSVRLPVAPTISPCAMATARMGIPPQHDREPCSCGLSAARPVAIASPRAYWSGYVSGEVFHLSCCDEMNTITT